MKRLLDLFKPQRPAPPVMKKVAEEQPSAAETAAAPRTDHQTLILIAAALAAYGYAPSQIVSIRPVGVSGWTHAVRVETVQNRIRMFH